MFLKVENKSHPSLARAQWEERLDRVPFKTFFHTLEWEDFFEKQFSWMRFERYIWKDQLLLSVARCRLFGKEKIVSHPLCEYGGPLPLKESCDFKSFTNDFQKKFGSKARIKFHPYILQYGQSPIVPRPDSRISTFWIEDFSKKSPKDLWDGFRKTLKQEIKRGEGFIRVEGGRGKSELEQFYGIYLRTVKKHKNIPLPFSIFRFLDENAKVFLAKNGDKVVGGSIFLLYPPFIHYFISASDEKFRDKNIGHQILWHVIQEYAGGSYDYFDLGGTRKGSVLEVFKRGWGAQDYPIYEGGGTARETGSSSFRWMLGALPSSMTKLVASLALWLKV